VNIIVGFLLLRREDDARVVALFTPVAWMRIENIVVVVSYLPRVADEILVFL
jgi:hypothetical protein